MAHRPIIVALIFLASFQCATSIFNWKWPWSSRCSHPLPSQGTTKATYNDYFYGSTSVIFTWGKRGDIVHPLHPRHSLLMFRGKIFEWGIRYTYKMDRRPDSCKISWNFSSKAESKCILSDAEKWTRAYKETYGEYGVLTNNGNHFVNRLARYLNTNCGR